MPHAKPLTTPFDGYREFNDCPHLTRAGDPCPFCTPPRREKTPDHVPAFRVVREWDESEVLSALDIL